MRKLLITLPLIALPLTSLPVIGEPLHAEPPFTAQQEKRIQELIKQTLVADPLVFEQALQAWEQKSQQDQKQQIIDLISKNKVALYEDPASPRIGAKKPTLTMVVFTDYNCPYCKQFDPQLEKIIKNYPDVALVLKTLPFKGESSVTSGLLALTVWQKHPEQFWKLHHALMDKKGMHDAESIKQAQIKSGATAVENSEQSSEELKNNLKLAQQFGVQGTPFTLVGTEIVQGAIPYEQLEVLVKQQLAKPNTH
jgi:protein-disulfide isomerase